MVEFGGWASNANKGSGAGAGGNGVEGGKGSESKDFPNSLYGIVRRVTRTLPYVLGPVHHFLHHSSNSFLIQCIGNASLPRNQNPRPLFCAKEHYITGGDGGRRIGEVSVQSSWSGDDRKMQHSII